MLIRRTAGLSAGYLQGLCPFFIPRAIKGKNEGTGVESGGFSPYRGLSHFPQGFAQVPQLLL